MKVVIPSAITAFLNILPVAARSTCPTERRNVGPVAGFLTLIDRLPNEPQRTPQLQATDLFAFIVATEELRATADG
jgi:hypothetical protein